MKDFSLGKSSTVFQNRARELGNLVLTNKKYQETRFVRSLIRGLRSGLQNLPTIIAIRSQEFENAALEGRNADGKVLETIVNRLRCSANLVKTIGVVQLLEIYASTSLEAQQSTHFPTQVWTSINDAQKKLRDLAEKWTWSKESLKFSMIEAPSVIIDRLVDESIYRPKILQKNILRKGQELRNAGLLTENQKVKDLFGDDNETVIALAGEQLIIPITREDINVIEGKLSKFAREGNINRTEEKTCPVTF